MNKSNSSNEHKMSIVEAVETLSNIADLDFDAEVGVTQAHRLVIQDQEVTYRTVHWLARGELTETIRAVRETFKTILDYLRIFYRQEYQQPHDLKTLEGIKTIMVLVGEAAKKLDKYTSVFKRHKVGSVTNLREFQQLQNFYRNRVVKEETERKELDQLFQKKVLPYSERRLEGAAKLKRRRKIDPEKVIIDLESVKKDTDYELLFLRKEEGKMFFNPRLIRNMKLVTDFGETFGVRRTDDPLRQIPIWSDKMFFVAANNILAGSRSEIEDFHRQCAKQGERELTANLYKALMALYLCSNSGNQLKKNPVKNCQRYFHDFQAYLRRSIGSKEYQHNLVYKPKGKDASEQTLMNLANSLCRSLYTQGQGHREMSAPIELLIKNERTGPAPTQISDAIAEREQILRKVTKGHAHGPLVRTLDLMGKRTGLTFDPLIQDNIPNQLWDLYLKDFRMAHLRIPSPTMQTRVSRAEVVPEFKAMLRSYSTGSIIKKHLLFNLQDRTTWKEHARCDALEALQKQAEFSDDLLVITFPKDTDFYHQLPPYDRQEGYRAFKRQLKEHCRSSASGFLIPQKYRGELLGEPLDAMVEHIHALFFQDAKKLKRQERLTFIELLYVCLQLKLLAMIRPDSFSLSCKDEIDVGAAASGQLYGFIHAAAGRTAEPEIMEMMDLILFGPALAVRERLIDPCRFSRMLAPLQAVEELHAALGDQEFETEMIKLFDSLGGLKLKEIQAVSPRKKTVSH